MNPYATSYVRTSAPVSRLGEAAPPSVTPTRAHPSLRTMLTALQTLVVRPIRAAGRMTSVLRGVAMECRAAAWRAIREEITFTVSERRRGYLRGITCSICRLDAHDTGEMCPKQWAALCDVCGPVLLDYFGNCPAPRAVQLAHRLTQRHPATEAEWRRPRRIAPTPIARGKPGPKD